MNSDYSSYKDLRESIECVILNIGDIVVDNLGGHIGILVKRCHHIDMIEDDVYVWEVKWINNVVREQYAENPMGSLLEEEGLKLSIVVGTYEWHSIDGGTFEL
tara:strand:- start:165 stop:473 length:309 start_codon:yes stop_codon:yes gene_type:complete